MYISSRILSRIIRLVSPTLSIRSYHCSNAFLKNSKVQFFSSIPARSASFARTVTMSQKWSMGPGTLEVPMSLYARNRARLAEQLSPGRVVLLQGGDDISHYDTDVHYVFRQESYFMWVCGVREPGCYVTVEGGSGRCVLFVPRLPEEYEVWMGRLLTCEDFRKMYAVDQVYYVDQIAEVLKSLKPEKLLTLSGLNTDSGLMSKEANFEGILDFEIDNTTLFPIIAELRVVKTEEEIEVMRYVVKASSDAHKKVMLYARPGVHEYECEAVFLEHCYRAAGCRHVSYTCICGSGHNSATLHYGHAAQPNDKMIRDGDMCLFDMGGNYAGYAADITCSFPANGKFTEDQRVVYEAVLAARNTALAMLKPGVLWSDVHRAANVTMLGELKKAGLLKGDVEDMMEAGIGAILQPHGLGHLLGLDVHDVGGYLPTCPPRPTAPGLARLRTARALLPHMLLTVEPGCYFIDRLLDQALQDPRQRQFFDEGVLQRFRGSGGVRIEDDVLITSTGHENLTVVPRTVEEIEKFMADGANFKKQSQ